MFYACSSYVFTYSFLVYLSILRLLVRGSFLIQRGKLRVPLLDVCRFNHLRTRSCGNNINSIEVIWFEKRNSNIFPIILLFVALSWKAQPLSIVKNKFIMPFFEKNDIDMKFKRPNASIKKRCVFCPRFGYLLFTNIRWTLL